jgi:hypothetical protein
MKRTGQTIDSVCTDTRSKICVSYCDTVDMEKIQSFHVRNIFSLVMPLQTDRLPHLNPNGAPSNFGFTITFPDNPLPYHYRINMYSDFRKVPKRFVRFEIECFTNGSFQNKCISEVCQVLGKRRTLRSSDIEQGEQAKITILLII